MIVFDDVLPRLEKILYEQRETINHLGSFLINRDLDGCIRLILDEQLEGNASLHDALETLCRQIYEELAPHAYPPEQAILYDIPPFEDARQGGVCFDYGERLPFTVIDRLVTDGTWSPVSKVSEHTPRIVFFSIKGGVGRSTALAIAARRFARNGKKVLVLDLDLESPGLSSALLPEDRRPARGILDWLVEDLVNNGDELISDMYAVSPLVEDGDIYVVPAHGSNPGDYVAKLGRAWMPKLDATGRQEPWAERLCRLLEKLENNLQPDVILIDSRAGIDDTASVCITGLGAQTVLLFAMDGSQTWTGYDILFRYWNHAGQATAIRDRLQVVAAMIPEREDKKEYFERLREHAWDCFRNNFYDTVPAELGDNVDFFSFNESDESAPHYPWAIYWNLGLTALQSLHDVDSRLDEAQLTAVFPFLEKLAEQIEIEAIDEA